MQAVSFPSVEAGGSASLPAGSEYAVVLPFSTGNVQMALPQSPMTLVAGGWVTTATGQTFGAVVAPVSGNVSAAGGAVSWAWADPEGTQFTVGYSAFGPLIPLTARTTATIVTPYGSSGAGILTSSTRVFWVLINGATPDLLPQGSRVTATMAFAVLNVPQPAAGVCAAPLMTNKSAGAKQAVYDLPTWSFKALPAWRIDQACGVSEAPLAVEIAGSGLALQLPLDEIYYTPGIASQYAVQWVRSAGDVINTPVVQFPQRVASMPGGTPLGIVGVANPARGGALDWTLTLGAQTVVAEMPIESSLAPPTSGVMQLLIYPDLYRGGAGTFPAAQPAPVPLPLGPSGLCLVGSVPPGWYVNGAGPFGSGAVALTQDVVVPPYSLVDLAELLVLYVAYGDVVGVATAVGGVVSGKTLDNSTSANFWNAGPYYGHVDTVALDMVLTYPGGGEAARIPLPQEQVQRLGYSGQNGWWNLGLPSTTPAGSPFVCTPPGATTDHPPSQPPFSPTPGPTPPTPTPPTPTPTPTPSSNIIWILAAAAAAAVIVLVFIASRG